MATGSNTNPELRAQWDKALQHLAEAETAYRHYEKTVWEPAYERELAFEESHGLVAPGTDPRRATPDYMEKRAALLSAHPLFAIPDDVNDEIERLSTAFADAQTALMKLEAPDQAALRWKLDHVLELEDTDSPHGGSIPCWTAGYVLQTIADYRRLLPEAA